MFINTKETKLVENHIFVNQTFLVEELLNKEILDFSDIENLYDSDEEVKEIFEWWLVSDWLAYHLRKQNEVIIEYYGSYWWGRTCFGQAIAMDGNIKQIANKLDCR